MNTRFTSTNKDQSTNLKSCRQSGISLTGPIPQSWIRIAAHLPGKSLHLGLVIWCAASMNRNRSVSISNVDALGFGLERNAKYRALDWLEQAGLIAVQRKLGCSPVVTLLAVGGGHGDQ